MVVVILMAKFVDNRYFSHNLQW